MKVPKVLHTHTVCVCVCDITFTCEQASNQDNNNSNSNNKNKIKNLEKRKTKRNGKIFRRKFEEKSGNRKLNTQNNIRHKSITYIVNIHGVFSFI